MIPVTLSEGDYLWESTLTTKAICILLRHLLNHDYTANERRLFPRLGIDMRTRRATDNVPNVETRKVHHYRIINKALAMELLSALLLTRINSATRVTSNCMTRHGLPHYFATAGKSDLTADYAATATTPEFQAVVEVSIKRVVTRQSYTEQLWEAQQHALNQARENDHKRFYALVINAGAIGTDVGLQRAFRQFMQRDDLETDERVRLIPIYAGDLAFAVHSLRDLLRGERFLFGSDKLTAIFDALHAGVLDPMPQHEPNWMCSTWINMAVDPPALDL